VAAQPAQLETYHVFGDLANRPALLLADRLAGPAPRPGSRVFLTSGGGDSIETGDRADGGGRARTRAARRRSRRPRSPGKPRPRRRLLTRGIRDGVALAPSLIVTDEHQELAVGALETALDALG
jgi:adenosylmethionine-8-amino-7-oxononanoate aminotransferase